MLQDFLTTNDGELCVSVGEILQVRETALSSPTSTQSTKLTFNVLQILSVVDKFWVECRLDQREGSVPAANIAPVSLTGLLQPEEVICVARSGHIAQSIQQLNLRKGKASVSIADVCI